MSGLNSLDKNFIETRGWFSQNIDTKFFDQSLFFDTKFFDTNHLLYYCRVLYKSVFAGELT